MAKWFEKTLGEVTAFIAKGIPPKYTEEENENTIRVLNQKCNRNFEISYNESRIHDCEKKKVPVDKMLRAGDVLINSTGTGTAGRVAQMVEVTVPTTIDGHMILIRPSEELDPIYYGYAVKSFQSQIEGLAEGSTGQTEINRKRLQDEVIIRYPSDKLVQKNIGSFLANIDEKIKTNKEINKNLDQQTQELFKAWFVTFETFGGKMPSSWSVAKLGDVANIKTNSFSPAKNPTVMLEHYSIPAFDEQKYPVFELASNVKSNKYILTDNSVMISKLNPGTKRVWRPMCISEFAVSSTEFIIFEANDPTYKDYVFSVIDSPAFSDWMCAHTTGSTNSRQRTTPSTTLEFQIALPTQEIVSDFCKIVTPMYDMIAQNTCENRKLAIFRDSLLPKLMSGELDVSNIDL